MGKVVRKVVRTEVSTIVRQVESKVARFSYAVIFAMTSIGLFSPAVHAAFFDTLKSTITQINNTVPNIPIPGTQPTNPVTEPPIPESEKCNPSYLTRYTQDQGCWVSAAIGYTYDGYETGGYLDTQGPKSAIRAKVYPAFSSGTAVGGMTPSFDRVLVVVTAFDPDATVPSPDKFYDQYLTRQSLGTRLRYSGYDIVTLYMGSSSKNFIQRNAMAVVEALKVIESSRSSVRPMAVLGFSMGGLVARYALTYMESVGLDHHTNLYISYDSPHRGANASVGGQELAYFLRDAFNNAKSEMDSGGILEQVLRAPFDFLGNLLKDQTITEAIDAGRAAYEQGASYANSYIGSWITSPAARQMIINNRSNPILSRNTSTNIRRAICNIFQSPTFCDPVAPIPWNHPYDSHPDRYYLLEELEELGSYPKKLRKVAFTNGSVTGNLQAHHRASGDQLVGYRGSKNLSGTSVDLVLDLAVWTHTGNKVFWGKMTGPHKVDALLGLYWKNGTYLERTSYIPQDGEPLDHVPGSYSQPFKTTLDVINRQLAGQLSPVRPHPTITDIAFIPTVSALDIDPDKIGGYGANLLQLAPDVTRLSTLTPFDEVYFPLIGSNGTANEMHLEITATNATRLIDELTALP